MQVKDEGCCARKLGPVHPHPDRLGRARGPALLDFALDPDARSLLPVSAALSLL